MRKLIILLISFSFNYYSFSQQVADTTYNPVIKNPEYKPGKGPIVYIDEGHSNFHTKDGRYKAFATLLERDGYKVKSYSGEFDKEKLETGKILVISNALNKKNEENWYKPVFPAFTENEINTVKEWVSGGGNLFLIADHMPFGGAAKNLAAAFGFELSDGFARDTTSNHPDYFNLNEKTLVRSSITEGRNRNESVQQIVSFTGQAFKIPSDAKPILKFTEKYVILLPDTAWVFDKNTEIINAKGRYQGAFKKFGKGKIVVSGEAAMFSAQLAGPQKIKAGMNREDARENYKLLLNIIHWLDGKLE
ncbi:MAG: DUF4350 domain-containing protein [Prolixibacteraceae bacterium]|nr:DUF4350 domain-containing protein [Prolixibacteraceae bacterium]